MCGRYASTKSAADIATEFHAVDATARSALAAPGADYNVAPTKPVLAVVQRHPRDEDGTADTGRTERSVRVMRWGLVPSWAKDPSVGSRMINARAETAADKPAFRKALARRRCLLPADGWYEWRRDGRTKQPYFITGADGASLAMAGVWEFWRAPDGGEDEPLITTAVVTTDAVGPMRDIHDRMPLLIAPDDWAAWLDPDADQVSELLRPPSAELVAGLELRTVSALVNNVRNEGPELVERVDPVTAPDEHRQTLALDL
ncbi:SOS response-associated peptidase [Pseudonocardia acaciae]|uniref:SOS response-associated peptidase n=1 Tax=Pseudonocardia acaciae TaxID=551276 RepID=UPI00048CCDAC|nr:SOS response-associated peptidase [Pseudonocardia acaciae]